MEIEVEYVAEEPDLADGLLADFKSIFDKFTFKDTPAAAEVYAIQTHPPPSIRSSRGAKPYEIRNPAALQAETIDTHWFVSFWQDGEKKDEAGADAAKKGSGSDSDDDEQDAQQKKKEGGISNKKKKVCSLSLSVCLLLLWNDLL